MAKNRNRQRDNRRLFSKDDRVEMKTVAGAKDTTPYYAMRNLTRRAREEAKFI